MTNTPGKTPVVKLTDDIGVINDRLRHIMNDTRVLRREDYGAVADLKDALTEVRDTINDFFVRIA